MRATKLMHMAVISIAEGERAGQVADLAILATAPQIAAFILKADHDGTMLPFEAIRKIGPDAIMIDRLAVLSDDEAAPGADETRRFTSLLGKETAGDDGSYLGDVKDFEIDPETGHINTIQLHRGGVLGIGGDDIEVPGSHLHAFGSRLLTVTPPIVEPPASEDRIDDRSTVAAPTRR